MNLIEFVNKWEKDRQSLLIGQIASFFDRDVRTVKNWYYKTPRYVQWILRVVDEKWEDKGKNYAIFFDL